LTQCPTVAPVRSSLPGIGAEAAGAATARFLAAGAATARFLAAAAARSRTSIPTKNIANILWNDLGDGANVGMILFGWLQERMNPPGRTSTTMLPFWFGALVGITPWVAMGVNILFYSDVRAAIYAVLIAQGLFFFCFGLNQWLQYKGIGRWADYAVGEKTYLVLSLGAKSLLAVTASIDRDGTIVRAIDPVK